MGTCDPGFGFWLTGGAEDLGNPFQGSDCPVFSGLNRCEACPPEIQDKDAINLILTDLSLKPDLSGNTFFREPDFRLRP